MIHRITKVHDNDNFLIIYNNVTMCHAQELGGKLGYMYLTVLLMSRDMIFPTMWYVRPAKAKISLRICAV